MLTRNPVKNFSIVSSVLTVVDTYGRIQGLPPCQWYGCAHFMVHSSMHGNCWINLRYARTSGHQFTRTASIVNALF